MPDPLYIYLSDHLAGSKFAADLLAILRDENPDNDLGTFAAEILAEVEEDRTVLKSLLERVGNGRSSKVKEAIGAVGEKASQLKLRRQARREPGTLESLEMLAVGILGKRCLWRALDVIAPTDPRLTGYQYRELIARAQEQYDRVETRRLQAAREVFQPPEE